MDHCVHRHHGLDAEGDQGPGPQQDGDHDPSLLWTQVLGGSGLHPSLTVHLPTDVGGPPGPASPQMLLDCEQTHKALAV